MAASEEFPRGMWLVDNRGDGPNAASVTFPASPGIAWVLAQIDAILWVNSAGTFTSNVLTNLPNALPITFMGGPASALQSFEWTWSGQIATPNGAALTVSFSAPTITGVTEILNVYAFPI